MPQSTMHGRPTRSLATSAPNLRPQADVARWAAVVALLALLLASAPTAAQTCAVMEDPALPGQLLGCCDESGAVRADGSPCISEANSCRRGTCASGHCVGTTPIGTGSDHPACVDPVNVCRRGQCYNGTCKKEGGSGSPEAVMCPGDDNFCTVDCQADASTPFPLDHVCGPIPLTGPSCSVATGGATCARGVCAAGTCVPTSGEITCEGSAGECEEFVCVDGGPTPSCQRRPREVGTPCQQDADGPDDCHQRECQVAADGSGRCRNVGRVGLTCDDGDGEPCTRGICNAKNRCVQSAAVADLTPCPGHHECDAGTCLQGVCTHGPTSDGTPCTGQAGVCLVADAAACQDGVCRTPPQPDGTPCPGEFGRCRVGALATCEEGACTAPSLPDGTHCDDGNPCTNQSLCADGACVATSCNAGAMCTLCGVACDDVLPQCGCVPGLQ